MNYAGIAAGVVAGVGGTVALARAWTPAERTYTTFGAYLGRGMVAGGGAVAIAGLASLGAGAAGLHGAAAALRSVALGAGLVAGAAGMLTFGAIQEQALYRPASGP